MAAFTAITSGLDWQDVDFINEFRNAHSERSQSIGGSSVADISAGQDIQAAAFWATFQNWLEDNCDSFVDDQATIAGQTSVPMLDLPTWRTNAGLNASGFRRATSWVPGAVDGTWQNDVSFSYGTMQAGDIIGPWIFDDLQKGFSALKWTTSDQVSGSDYEQKFGSGSGADCYETILDFDANWPSSWSGESTGFIYYTYLYVVSQTLVVGIRYRGKPIITSIPTVVDHSCDIYLKPAAISGVAYSDIDDAGFAEDELCFYETLGSATTATRTGTPPPQGANLLTEAGQTSCPLTTTEEGCVIDSSAIYPVFKWSFTYSN